MSVVSFLNFRGMRPVISSKLLPENFARPAINTLFTSGNLRSYYQPLSKGTLGKQTDKLKTLYELKEDVWLHWVEEVNVARIPIAENDLNRVAFTGTDMPRVTNELLAISGGGDNYPEVSYALGIPAPDKILEAARYVTTPDGVQLNWDIAGTAEDEIGDRIARVYTYTFVNSFGEEGPPADPSQVAYTNDDECAELTNFASAPAGPYLIDKVRIYRSLSSATGDTTYSLVDEVSFPVTEPYRDCKADVDLGESLLSETWFPPPTNLRGIVAMANGMLAGFVDNTLYFSEPYQGHAWPEDYQRAVDYDIIGLAAAGNMLFVMTTGYPYVAVGNHPDVISLNKLERSQACTSSRSIVDMGEGAIYASAEGLVLITPSGTRVITEGVFDNRVWEYIDPTTVHGHFYKDKYFGFYKVPVGVTQTIGIPDEGAFIFDLKNQDVVFTEQIGDSGYFDPTDGFLYFTRGLPNTLYAWDADDTGKLTHRWRSREIQASRQNLTAARVSALAYPVTFRLLVDDQVKMTKTVSSERPFRLLSGFTARDWAVEVEGTEEIENVSLASTMDELW